MTFHYRTYKELIIPVVWFIPAWVRLWGWMKPSISKSGKREGREEAPASGIRRDPRIKPLLVGILPFSPYQKCCYYMEKGYRRYGEGFQDQSWAGDRPNPKGKVTRETSLPQVAAVLETKAAPSWDSQESKEPTPATGQDPHFQQEPSQPQCFSTWLTGWGFSFFNWRGVA